MTAGVTATWVPHRRNLIEAIKERPKPASTNRVEKSISNSSKKNGSTNGATNSEGEGTPQSRDTQPETTRNVTKRMVEKPTTTTNDNRDANNNSEKNPKLKTKSQENVAKGKCKSLNEVKRLQSVRLLVDSSGDTKH